MVRLRDRTRDFCSLPGIQSNAILTKAVAEGSQTLETDSGRLLGLARAPATDRLQIETAVTGVSALLVRILKLVTTERLPDAPAPVPTPVPTSVASGTGSAPSSAPSSAPTSPSSSVIRSEPAATPQLPLTPTSTLPGGPTNPLALPHGTVAPVEPAKMPAPDVSFVPHFRPLTSKPDSVIKRERRRTGVFAGVLDSEEGKADVASFLNGKAAEFQAYLATRRESAGSLEPVDPASPPKGFTMLHPSGSISLPDMSELSLVSDPTPDTDRPTLKDPQPQTPTTVPQTSPGQPADAKDPSGLEKRPSLRDTRGAANFTSSDFSNYIAEQTVAPLVGRDLPPEFRELLPADDVNIWLERPEDPRTPFSAFSSACVPS